MAVFSSGPAAGGHRGVAPPGEHRGVRGSPPGGLVKQQPAEQQRHLRPDVIGREQQHERPVAELRRQHDPGREHAANQAFWPAGPPAGEPAGRQDEQRVRHRRRHVDDAGPEGPDQLDEHVLGQFRRVERHVADGPAVQQPVPREHVPRLQRLRRTVRGGRHRPRHPQVAEEQQPGRQRDGRDAQAGREGNLTTAWNTLPFGMIVGISPRQPAAALLAWPPLRRLGRPPCHDSPPCLRRVPGRTAIGSDRGCRDAPVAAPAGAACPPATRPWWPRWPWCPWWP